MIDMIHIVVVDDNSRFRKGLAQTLKADASLDVVGQGATAEEAVQLVRELRPDILLLDIHLPGGGLTSAWSIKDCCPTTKVIILSGSQEEAHVQEAFQAGVKAYILKGIRGSELLRLIHGIWDGKPLKPSNMLLYHP